MKTTSPAMDGYLADSSATLNACLKLTAKDNTVLGFTNYTRPITFEGVTYSAVDGTTPTALQSTANLSVDNLDVIVTRSDNGISGPDLLRGKWDFADVRLFLVNPNDTSAGSLKIRRGRVGKVSLGRQKLTSEIRGLMEAFTKQTLDIVQPACRVDVGDDVCGVKMTPPLWLATNPETAFVNFDYKLGSTVRPTSENGRFFRCSIAGTTGGSEPSWDLVIGNTTADGGVTWVTVQANKVTGTITALFGNKRVFDSDRTESDDSFSGGLLEWLTGMNAGAQMEVKAYVNANGNFQLVLPMWFDLTIGDTFSVQLGCFKRLPEDCKAIFNNTHNFQGEPYVSQNFRISPAKIDQDSGGK
jgi:uncharacterized phage protein (TIGR02218 family)